MATKENSKQVLTVNEVAEITGITPQHIRQLCQMRKIKAANISTTSDRAIWMISRANLQAFLDGDTEAAVADMKRIRPQIKRI